MSTQLPEPRRIARDAIKPGEHFITVQKLGSGWAAVEMWLNNKDHAPDSFPEPWNTGFVRSAHREIALAEAVEWAVDEDLPLVEGP